MVWVDQTRQSSVEGVYAAGDITLNPQLAIVVAAETAMAAIHIDDSLIPSKRKANNLVPHQRKHQAPNLPRYSMTAN